MNNIGPSLATTVLEKPVLSAILDNTGGFQKDGNYYFAMIHEDTADTITEDNVFSVMGAFFHGFGIG
jgi:hypothetical protein